MVCAWWDIGCIVTEQLAPALAFLWTFIQVMAFIFGFAIVFLATRKLYSGRYVEANVLAGLWAGYVAYRLALWLAIAGAVAGIVVVLLAVFVPGGGVVLVWLQSKFGGKKHGSKK